MKIVQIPEQNGKATNEGNAHMKNAKEFFKLFIYLLLRKLWKAQILFFTLLGIAIVVLFLTLFYSDAVREELLRQRNLVADEVRFVNISNNWC